MITVAIFINNELILVEDAVNISEQHGVKYGIGKQYYRLRKSGKIITHKYEDGALELAKKILTHAKPKGS